MCDCTTGYQAYSLVLYPFTALPFQNDHALIQTGRGTGGPESPPCKITKILFFNNTGPDPLKNKKKHYQASIRWRSDDGPLLVVFGSSLSPHQGKNKVLKKVKEKKKKGWAPHHHPPPDRTFLDQRMMIHVEHIFFV